jgi:hypothetical protein
MGNGNPSNMVNFAVILAPLVVKTALSLSMVMSPPSLASAPPGGAGNATGPIPSTDYDDDFDEANKSIWIGLVGMSLVVIAILGFVVFPLYRRCKSGTGDAGRGHQWLRRAPDRSLSTYTSTEMPVAVRRFIRSPLHPNSGGILQSSRGGGVVVGIPISPSPWPHHQADGDAIPTISVSPPPHATYNNEYVISPTLLPPPFLPSSL